MSVPENSVDFNRLEAEIFAACCEQGRIALKTALQAFDRELAALRDKVKYRHKGLRKKTVKTVMGEVGISRAVYEVAGEDGLKHSVYLLDEALGIGGSGFFSGLLSAFIAKAACENSYRGAARSVSELTGQTVSHTAAWQVAQDLGNRVDEAEKQAAKLASRHKGIGKLETPILFEEQDGIWLKLQGKDRNKHGASREMKLAIAYDGAQKVGKKRYELTDKVACANFEGADKFQKRMEGVIAQTYNVDEIEFRFLNGDGAAWIKQAITDETVHFQLDPFHRNKAINQWVKNKAMRDEMMKILYSKDIDSLLVYIEACANSVEDESERNNLLDLLTYFTNNRDGLVPCHRRGLDLPEPPHGVEYRRMGCMESNVFTLVGNRMKGRRACWSVEGGNNLARLLCLKATRTLSQTLQSLTALVLPEKYAEEAVQILTSAKVEKRVGKGYNGFHQTTAPPTPDYKWLREWGSLRSLSEM